MYSPNINIQEADSINSTVVSSDNYIPVVGYVVSDTPTLATEDDESEANVVPTPIVTINNN